MLNPTTVVTYNVDMLVSTRTFVFRLRLAQCKMISKCKIFFRNENDFSFLVTSQKMFWKIF